MIDKERIMFGEGLIMQTISNDNYSNKIQTHFLEYHYVIIKNDTWPNRIILEEHLVLSINQI